MTYHGVKFKTEFISCEIPHDPRIEELKKWCKIFHDLNLAPAYKGGSFGNLSFRLKEGGNEFIITGSKIGLKDNLTNNCFVKVVNCDFKNNLILAQGSREPSSESLLHFAIYQKRKDVNAVFHGHNCEKLNLKNVVETKEEKPYGTIELVDSVLEVLGQNNFIIMKNHGFLMLGKSMGEAGRFCHCERQRSNH